LKNVRKKTGKGKNFEETDRFLGFTERVKIYVQDNPAQAKGVLAAIAVVIGLTVIITLFMDASAKRVQALQSEALGYYDVVSPSPGGEPLADNERYSKAAELFGKLSKDAGSGGEGRLGYFYEANANLKLGKTDEAIAGYNTLFDRRPGTLIGSLAGLKLAEVYLSKKDTDSAIGVLSKLSETGGYLKDEALYMLGQLYELTGRNDEAGGAYSKLTSEYGKSPRAAEAKARLDRLVEKQMETQESAPPAEKAPAKVK